MGRGVGFRFCPKLPFCMTFELLILSRAMCYHSGRAGRVLGGLFRPGLFSCSRVFQSDTKEVVESWSSTTPKTPILDPKTLGRAPWLRHFSSPQAQAAEAGRLKTWPLNPAA